MGMPDCFEDRHAQCSTPRMGTTVTYMSRLAAWHPRLYATISSVGRLRRPCPARWGAANIQMLVTARASPLTRLRLLRSAAANAATHRQTSAERSQVITGCHVCVPETTSAAADSTSLPCNWIPRFNAFRISMFEARDAPTTMRRTERTRRTPVLVSGSKRQLLKSSASRRLTLTFEVYPVPHPGAHCGWL